MIVILLAAIAIAVSIPLAILQAFAFQVLWGWFVTPTFGLSAPSLWMAFGLILMVNMLKSYAAEPDVQGDAAIAKMAGSVAYGILTPLFALLFGAFALWMAGA